MLHPGADRLDSCISGAAIGENAGDLAGHIWQAGDVANGSAPTFHYAAGNIRHTAVVENKLRVRALAGEF